MSIATTHPQESAPAGEPATSHPQVNRRHKWMLLGVAVLSYVLLWCVGGWMGIAVERGFDGSLLLSPGAVMNFIVTAVLALAALGLGTVLAGKIRPDAGLFAAAAGLLALSNHGRPIYAVLHDGGGSTYLTLAFELLLLSSILGIGWFALYRLQQSGQLPTDFQRDGLADPADQPANAGWYELVTQVLLTAAVVIVIAQSEDKKQVVAAVGIGGWVGAFFPYWKQGVRPSVWYWTGPLLVGMVGYLAAHFTIPKEAIQLGRPGFFGGYFAALARPLPLDYASVGTAGALVGYWMRRTGLRDRQLMEAANH